MKINAYLAFNGQCKAAFEFYAQCLNAKIVAMMTHANTPMASHVPPGWQDKIIHARLMVDDQVLMGSDSPPDRYEKPQGISVTVNIKEPAEAERVFHALEQGGTVSMPIQETFWAVRFGMLVDKFGIPWMINCEKAM
ncbi:MAG: 3-demethylubiquinone-9 3-methyltransferase [Phycisphaerales bacterium]|nr:3-demethylubiquinone-9 3-methyltransferase [Phycisphaerales bacterium]